MTFEIVIDSREQSQIRHPCLLCMCMCMSCILCPCMFWSSASCCCDAMQVLKSTAVRKYAGDLAYKDKALATDDALLIGRLHTYLSGISMFCTFMFVGVCHAAAWHLKTTKRCIGVMRTKQSSVICCQKCTVGLSASSVNVDYLTLEHMSMQAGQKPTLLSYRAGVTLSASTSHWCNRNVWLCGVAMIRY